MHYIPLPFSLLVFHSSPSLSSLASQMPRSARSLLSPLQHLSAHLNQPILGLALGERRYRLDGLIDVVLGQGAGLLEAGGREYDLAGLDANVSIVLQYS